MTPVAPRIVKSFICDEDEAGESFCVAGAALGEVQVSLFVAGAALADVQVPLIVASAAVGEVQVSLFVAGAALGEVPWFKCHFSWQWQYFVEQTRTGVVLCSTESYCL